MKCYNVSGLYNDFGTDVFTKKEINFVCGKG